MHSPPDDRNSFRNVCSVTRRRIFSCGSLVSSTGIGPVNFGFLFASATALAAAAVASLAAAFSAELWPNGSHDRRGGMAGTGAAAEARPPPPPPAPPTIVAALVELPLAPAPAGCSLLLALVMLTPAAAAFAEPAAAFAVSATDPATRFAASDTAAKDGSFGILDGVSAAATAAAADLSVVCSAWTALMSRCSMPAGSVVDLVNEKEPLPLEQSRITSFTSPTMPTSAIISCTSFGRSCANDCSVTPACTRIAR